MKRLVLPFILLCLTPVFAQKADWGMAAYYKHGFLMAHRPIMSHLPEEHCNALEVSLFFRGRGEKEWHKAYNYPTYGFSALVTGAGNREILGNYFGAFTYIQMGILRNDHSSLYGKVGTGLGYTTRVFDQLENPKNVAVSSHFNALILFALHYQYTLDKNRFKLGIDMTHFSNGAGTLPNLGINLAYFTLGYGRTVSSNQETALSREKVVPPDKSWKYSAIAILTSRDSYPIGEAKYPVIALSMTAQKSFRYALGYETAFDFIYKPSIQKYKPVIPKSNESMVQMGWYHGYFLSLDRLQIHLGMGVYLRDEYFANDRFYHRLGFRYAFKNGFLMNLMLKSHWAKADYIEYGLGYRF